MADHPGLSPFDLMAVLGRYRETVAAYIQMSDEGIQFGNELRAKAQEIQVILNTPALPIAAVTVAIQKFNELMALLDKYDALIKRAEANWPQAEKMINEALPLL